MRFEFHYYKIYIRFKNCNAFFPRSKDNILFKEEMDIATVRYVDFTDLIIIARNTREFKR